MERIGNWVGLKRGADFRGKCIVSPAFPAVLVTPPRPFPTVSAVPPRTPCEGCQRGCR